MPWLLDSNILLRGLHRTDPEHALARDAVFALWARGGRLCFTLQTLAEFWNVSTRPPGARGGFGLSLTETDRRMRLIERHLTFLPDTEAVRARWRQLVTAHAVVGVQVHDARLAASMLGHGVTHLLTLNTADFRRFPAIQAVHPRDVLDGHA